MDDQAEVHREGQEGVPSKLAAAGEQRRKRRRGDARPAPPRWKNPGEQQSYSSRVLVALRRVLSRGVPESASLPRRRAVREAADRALAAAAGGRMRWSRAIVASSRALKLRRKSRALSPRCARRPKAAAPTPVVGAEEEARAVAGKVRVLGRIVPGCRRLPLPSLLEEASDYIAALQMQVRAISALAEALSSRDHGAASHERVDPTFSTSSSPSSSQANL